MVDITPLPFVPDALEPEMPKESVLLHYEKHYKTYVEKLNKTIKDYPELADRDVTWLMQNTKDISNEIKQKVINFGGGVYNHEFFFSTLGKREEPYDKILTAIEKKYGTFENFQQEFTDKSLTLFGSGWTWLVINNNELEIITTQNQDCPLSNNMTPLLTLDIWEHAYYLKYKNKRNKYIEDFWKIIDWNKIDILFIESKK